jgi:hypothetical protein
MHNGHYGVALKVTQGDYGGTPARRLLFFTFLGVLGVASAISGVSQFTAELGRGTTIAMHPNSLSRIVAGCQGVIFLFFAWAICRRRPWVWRGVFYCFGACWAYSVLGIYVDLARQYPAQPRNETTMFAAATGLAFAAVAGYWSYRWYKKKPYFFPE